MREEITQNIKKIQSNLLNLKDTVEPDILEKIFQVFEYCASNKSGPPNPDKLFNVKKPMRRRNQLNPLT
jgi:hypothetical protein